MIVNSRMPFVPANIGVDGCSKGGEAFRICAYSIDGNNKNRLFTMEKLIPRNVVITSQKYGHLCYLEIWI